MSTSLPRINDPAPQFTAPSTTQGPFSLSDLKSRWTVLFSHPADFTPVCTTEFVEFARRHDEFARRNAEVVGLSVDSIYAHLAWVRAIEEKWKLKVPFRVIADRDMKVAQLYGMIQPNEADTATVRAVFFISPEGRNGDPQRVRAVIWYPLSIGRNMDEILRVLDALQTTSAHGVAAPCNWRPGEPVIVPPPTTKQAAEARRGEVEAAKGEYVDWWFSKKPLPGAAKA